jgi:PAS domain S-box-containing protein
MWRKLRQQIGKWWGVLITAPTVAGLVIIGTSAGLLQYVEWTAHDQFVRLRPREHPDSRIVVVTIGESDLAKIGQGQVPDQVLAELIQKLKAHQPRAIGLDLYRDLPVEPGHQKLVRVFESTPNLIGVEKIAGDVVAPPPTLDRLGQVAGADLMLDADGKVRRGFLTLENSQGKIQESLATKLALMYLQHEGITLEVVNPAKEQYRLGQAIFERFREYDAGYVRADAGGYQILLNFRGRQNNFRTLSLTDVLENRIPRDWIRNHIVLIGATGQSSNDLFFTPYSSTILTSPERMPGVMIHANLISQILSAALDGRTLIKSWPQPVEWLWVLGWSFAGASVRWLLLRATLQNQKLASNWGVTGLCIVVAAGILLTGGYLAFVNGWWIPVVSPLLAAMGSAVAVAGYHRLELEREKADLELVLETTTEHYDTLTTELQNQAEEAARESERKLAQFLDAVSVGVMVIDITGKPYFTNQRAQELLGKGVVASATIEKLSEAYQTYIAGTNQLYPIENLPIVRALKGERATVDDMEIHQGNRIIPLEVWGTPIYDESGNITYAIAAFQDITERKRAELERIRFTDQLYQLNQANERFVPRQFLQLLSKDSIIDVQIGDQVQLDMSILFADIRNFTTLSEQLTPEENFKFINTYLSQMEPAILDNNGFIDKYIGDAIMALFSRNANDAVRAGIDMLHRLTQYNKVRIDSAQPPIQIGIGINTGSLMLGTVGGPHRMDSTVISDAVNLASRLEGLTKYYGVSLLISHHTFGSLYHPIEYAFRVIDRLQVKGKSEMVSVFEIFDADPALLRDGKLKTKSKFEKALFLYNKHSFGEAGKLFQRCLDINPSDRVAQIYLERCRQSAIASHTD